MPCWKDSGASRAWHSSLVLMYNVDSERRKVDETIMLLVLLGMSTNSATTTTTATTTIGNDD